MAVPRKPATAKEQPPVKRGPGRPRKHPLPDPNAPRRKPGRPKKGEQPVNPDSEYNRTTILFDKDLHKWVLKVAKKKKTSVSKLVNAILNKIRSRV